MRLRNRPWALPELSECPYYISDMSANRGNWHNWFGNENPIWLEVGCGKGMYLSGMAPVNSDINFIGADLKSLMLAYARRNIEAAFADSGASVSNVALLSTDAERIAESFSEADSVDRIILNFSNPWPKPKHHKKRLTHPRQLEAYKVFMKEGSYIDFKTDNDEYYKDTVGYLTMCGFNIVEQYFDYYDSHPIDTSILTEHERKFLDLGLPIHYLEAKYR